MKYTPVHNISVENEPIKKAETYRLIKAVLLKKDRPVGIFRVKRYADRTVFFPFSKIYNLFSFMRFLHRILSISSLQLP